jgi:hypothetical protein
MLLFGNKPQSILEPPKGTEFTIAVVLLLWAIGSVIMFLDEVRLKIVRLKNHRTYNEY